MKTRFLITTADERTWRTNRPVLFLGEWCRLYSRRHIWENLDAEVVPYHWDDREQLYRDYTYLNTLYEELLGELTETLNQFHGVDYPLRYWRILIGPWLNHFIEIIYDRWTMIHRAVDNYDIEGTVLVDMPPEDVIPNDMAQFAKCFIGDAWNHQIYSKIIMNSTSMPYKYISPGKEESDVGKTVSYLAKPGKLGVLLGRARTAVVRPDAALYFISRYFVKFMPLLSKMMVGKSDAFIFNSYLPPAEDMRLKLRLGQIPIYWPNQSPPQIAVVPAVRTQLKLGDNTLEGFVGCIRRLIPEQIPPLYLEGFNQLCEFTEKLPWPKSPSVVMTAVSHFFDDVFKCYAANTILHGTPLVIMGHGASGKYLYSSCEKHEMVIPDAYYTWGDSHKQSNCIPAFISKTVGLKRIAQNPLGGILLVLYTPPRYSYHMQASPTYNQWIESYLNEQFRFAGALPAELRKHLTVRLYHHEENGMEERWRECFPEVRLAPMSLHYETLVRENRLFVSTYNCTTYVESIARNHATIFFWNPKHWELLPEAQPYFDRLKDVGIFHETPESATKQIASIWEDVSGWWGSSEVQYARLYFCDRFARLPDKPIQMLADQLKALKNA